MKVEAGQALGLLEGELRLAGAASGTDISTLDPAEIRAKAQDARRKGGKNAAAAEKKRPSPVPQYHTKHSANMAKAAASLGRANYTGTSLHYFQDFSVIPHADFEAAARASNLFISQPAHQREAWLASIFAAFSHIYNVKLTSYNGTPRQPVSLTVAAFQRIVRLVHPLGGVTRR